MADKKISQLPEMVALGGDDLFVSVDDPNVSPVTKKINFYNVYQSMPGHGIDTRIATVVVAQDGSGDFSNIQSGIDAIPAAGGLLFIKNGTYSISTALLVKKSNITIQGQGPGTIIQVAAGQNVQPLKVGDGANAYSHIIIKDLKIDGNKANATSPYGIWCYSLVSYLTISGCWFLNCTQFGVNIGAAVVDLVITDNTFETNGQGGINLSQVVGALVSRNFFFNTADSTHAAIFASNNSQCIFSKNYILDVGTSSAGHGVVMYESSWCTIFENVFNGVNKGVSYQYFSTPGSFNLIQGNLFYSTYSNGIQGLSEGDIIVGNKLNNCGADAISNSRGYLQILANTISGTAGNAIMVSYDDVVISGNYIYNASGHGVSVGGKGCRIVNNTFRNIKINPVYINADYCVVVGNIFDGTMQETIYITAKWHNVIGENIWKTPNPPVANFYSAIYLKADGTPFAFYNLVRGNNISKEAAGNSFKYAICEFDTNADVNYFSENMIAGIGTQNIKVSGLRTRLSQNFYVDGV